MRFGLVGVLGTVLLSSCALSAQVSTGQLKAVPHATILHSTEIATAIQRGDTGAVADAVLRVVPIDTAFNVGLSVVRRSQVHGRTPPDAIVHDAVTEVYHILEGRGVLVTGGTIEAPTRLPNSDPDVRQQIGPSAVGTVIRGGTRQLVGPGDLVIIPAHTAHGFIEIRTARIVYVLVRIDPQHVLETRDRAR